MPQQNINGAVGNNNFISNVIPNPPPTNYSYPVTQSEDVSIVGGLLVDTIALIANSNNFTVSSSGGDDSLIFNGQLFNSSLDAGSGNDSLDLGPNSPGVVPAWTPTEVAISNVTVKTGTGDDSVRLRGSVNATTVDAASGNDTIVMVPGFNDLAGGPYPYVLPVLANSSLQSGVGSDSILLTGTIVNSVVNAAGDNDTVAITGGQFTTITNSSVLAGVGDDSVYVNVQSIVNSTVDAQQGYDTIAIRASSIIGSSILDASPATGDVNKVAIASDLIDRSFVRTQGQSDLITLQSFSADPTFLVNSTVMSNGGNDTLLFATQFFSNASINAGAGNDSVVIGGAARSVILDTTVTSGNGNDTVVLTGEVANASIVGESGNDSLNIQTSNPNGGVRNSTIDGGTLSDVINIETGFINPSSISGGGASDTINIIANNYIEKSVVDSGSDKDLVLIGAGFIGNSTIAGSGGDDSVVIESDAGIVNTSIDGGSGNDTLAIFTSDIINSSVNGGQLNDSIAIIADIYNSTISGGSTDAASDTIRIAGDVILNSRVSTADGSLGNVIELDASCAIFNSTVVSNGGADTIDVNTPVVIDSQLLAGNGDNRVTLDFLGDINPVFTNSTLASGDGNDSLTILASRQLDGLVISNSSISSGAANDTVDITAYSVLLSSLNFGAGDDKAIVATSLFDNSTLDAGAGNDSVALPELGILRNSALLTGDGNDTVTVNATTDITQVTLIINSTINTGANDDSINLLQSNLLDSRIDAGDGNNLVDINSTTAQATFDAAELNLTNSTITSGDGNDTILGKFDLITNATVSSAGGADFVGLRSLTDILSTTVTSGAGNDSVYLWADNDTLRVISQVFVATGADDDSVFIQAGSTVPGSNSRVDTSTVDAGSGRDTITINAGLLVNSSVQAGSQNDWIFITTGQGPIGETTINSTISGGDGNDNISIVGNVANSSITGGSVADEGLSFYTDDYITFASNDPSGSYIRNSTVGGNSLGDDTIVANMSTIEGSLFQVQDGLNKFDLTAGRFTNNTVLGGTGVDSVLINSTLACTALDSLRIVTNGFSDYVSVRANDDILNLSVVVDNPTAPSSAGDDSVFIDAAGSLANATIESYWGNDLISLKASPDITAITVNGGSGNDTVIASAVNLLNSSLDGGAGDDSVYAVATTLIANSTLSGGAGSNDTIVVLSPTIGNDSVASLDGNDLILAGVSVSFANDSITLTPATLITNSTLNSGTGNDTVGVFAGTQERSLISLDAGNDFAHVYSTSSYANSTLDAGSGNDTVRFDPSGGVHQNVLIDLGADNDVAIVNTLTFANSTLLGGTGQDSVDLNVGSTTLINSSVDGGLGNDTLDLIHVPTVVNSTVTGNAGNDLVLIGAPLSVGTTGNLFQLQGGAGTDTLTINPNASSQTVDLLDALVNEFEFYSLGNTNTLRVNALAAGPQTQTLSGNSSTFYVKAVTDDNTTEANVDLSGVTLSGWSPAGRIIIDASGATASKVLNGNVRTAPGFEYLAAISILGGSANDSIIGGTGNDTILSGAGNDTISSGTGADSIDAASGDDSILAGAGNDTVLGQAGYDTIFGDLGDDSILGGADNDTIDGGANADRLFGDAGNDSILGSAGNDYLAGGANNDTLLGGVDNDTLLGGQGADLLTGGTGNDTLAWLAGDQVNATTFTDNNDTIYGAGDTWDFANGVDLVTGASAAEILGDTFAIGGVGANPTIQNLNGLSLSQYRNAANSQAVYYINGTFDTSGNRFTAAGNSPNTWTHTLVSRGLSGSNATVTGIFGTDIGSGSTGASAQYTFLIDWGTAGNVDITSAKFIDNTGF